MPRLSVSAVFFVALASQASAQTPASSPAPSEPQLSPRAAYYDAMHPLDVTRHSVANWSDIELAALNVTIGRAAKECATRDAHNVSGEALIDFARLCALGQAWPVVVQATDLYLHSDDPAKPLLNVAWAAQVDAQLHLKDEPAAFHGAQAMLAAVPYDSLVAETVGEAIDYMQFAFTPDALTLANAREPLLLARLTATITPPPAAAREAATSQISAAYPPEPPQTIHELYADGLACAALQQLSKRPPAEVAGTVAALDALLPPTLAPDESLPIAAARRRYALLGQPVPDIAATAYLSMPGRIPRVPAVNALTALLLFPDWCAQCVRMGSRFPQTVFTVAGHEAYLYGLLVETVPPRKPAPAGKNDPPPTGFSPGLSAAALAETPTLVVPPGALDQFSANDFPFLILTDAQGLVRVAQPVSEDAILPGNTIDSAIAAVGAQWPHPKRGSATAAPPPASAKPGPPEE